MVSLRHLILTKKENSESSIPHATLCPYILNCGCESRSRHFEASPVIEVIEVTVKLGLGAANSNLSRVSITCPIDTIT